GEAVLDRLAQRDERLALLVRRPVVRIEERPRALREGLAEAIHAEALDDAVREKRSGGPGDGRDELRLLDLARHRHALIELGLRRSELVRDPVELVDRRL